MSSKICTCKWGINVLYNSVYTHSTRVILRELCETKRGGVISGGNNTNSNDGDSLYGLLSSVRGNEFLRSNSNNKPTVSNTSSGARYSRICMRGVFSREPDTK